MSLTALIILFTAGAIALLVGELLLPTHGLLGLLAGGCLAVAVIFVFMINLWAGAITLAWLAMASPFAASGLLKLWTRTPIGRAVVLRPEPVDPAPPAVALGMEGVTISELRPMGEVEFGADRLEVISELGLIAPGTRVRVVSLNGDKPTVRVVRKQLKTKAPAD